MIRCSNCGKEVEEICAACTRCKNCKESICQNHMDRVADGVKITRSGKKAKIGKKSGK